MALQREIRGGAPGGLEFAPLSAIARKRARRARPLAPLARAVRYWIPQQDPIEMHSGWTGPKVSKSWKRIAEKHQRGFEVDVSQRQRRFLARYGGQMKRSRFKPYFFIRQDTRRFDVPARPIMAPFWAAHENRAKRNITKNYQRKLRGERI